MLKNHLLFEIENWPVNFLKGSPGCPREKSLSLRVIPKRLLCFQTEKKGLGDVFPAYPDTYTFATLKTLFFQELDELIHRKCFSGQEKGFYSRGLKLL